MLLTSSQVSVLLSFGIVLFFTAALFLSGVAIQQRTLRDLRKAIRPDQPRARPNPSPKIYLPDRFRKSTTELEDGTVVEIDDPEEDELPLLEVRLSGDTKGEEARRRLMRVQGRSAEEQDDARGINNVEEEGLPQQPEEREVEEKVSSYERRRRIKEEIKRLAQGDSPVVYQRRLW